MRKANHGRTLLTSSWRKISLVKIIRKTIINYNLYRCNIATILFAKINIFWKNIIIKCFIIQYDIQYFKSSCRIDLGFPIFVLYVRSKSVTEGVFLNIFRIDILISRMVQLVSYRCVYLKYTRNTRNSIFALSNLIIFLTTDKFCAFLL